MPRYGATQFAMPDFHGATRRLVLVNMFAYFGLALLVLTMPPLKASGLLSGLAFDPYLFLHGGFWQPLTYSLVHPPGALMGTLFELLSIWFLAGFLENFHNSTWITSLYAVSVLGTAVAATAIYACAGTFGFAISEIPLAGCMGGIFGLLVAIGVLYGNTQFLMFFIIGIKAKYLVAIYALIEVASLLFSQQRMHAFAQLGGALAGLLYVRLASRRGITFAFSEKWYGLRNRYYRWKRRRASRKFEVYMRRQGRTVHIDGYGRPIEKDPDDKKHWN